MSHRFITVECPASEIICEDPDASDPSSSLYCSTNQICGGVQLGALASDGIGSGIGSSSIADGSGIGGSSSMLQLSGAAGSSSATADPAELAAGSAVPPTVTLLGPATIRVPQGGSLRPCPAGGFATAGSACDPGATASLINPGDLDHVVVACADKATRAKVRQYMRQYMEEWACCQCGGSVVAVWLQCGV